MGKGGQNGVTDEDVAKVPKKLVKVTLAEMKKHNKINDAWVSMGNKVRFCRRPATFFSYQRCSRTCIMQAC